MDYAQYAEPPVRRGASRSPWRPGGRAYRRHCALSPRSGSITPSEWNPVGAHAPSADYFPLTTGVPQRGSRAQTLQFCAACVCRGETGFYKFLTGKAGSLRGIERVETAPVIRTVKQGSAVIGARKSFSRTERGDSPRQI